MTEIPYKFYTVATNIDLFYGFQSSYFRKVINKRVKEKNILVKAFVLITYNIEFKSTIICLNVAYEKPEKVPLHVFLRWTLMKPGVSDKLSAYRHRVTIIIVLQTTVLDWSIDNDS